MSQIPYRAAFGLATLASAVLLTLIPATADAATVPTQATGQATGQSCWHDVDTGASSCFATGSMSPAQAIAQATGDPVVATPTVESGTSSAAPASGSASRSASQPAPAAGQSATTNFLLVVLYDGTNMTGNSNSYFTTNTKICVGIINQFPALSNFNDRTESFASFNGCQTSLWTDLNFGGTQYGPLASSTSLGTLNNTASSMIATD
jgi:hypothetical protein